MNVRVSRASAVIVQRIAAADTSWFLEWQGHTTEAAETFDGYCGTDVFPPADGRADNEWVVLVHFEDDKALNRWLQSPARAHCLETLRTRVGTFELKTFQEGFGPWFAATAHDNAGSAPPSWKMALTVLLGLYPTVMLLTIGVGPITSPLGLALSMLIGNAFSVSLLQWGLMPLLTRLLQPWLRANEPKPSARLRSGLGFGLILLLLAALTLVFRQTTG